MAVSYGGIIEGTQSAASTTAAVSFAGYSAGQFALVLITRNYSDSAASVPAGWSLLASHVDAEWDASFLYWKILEAGDIGTVTWSGYSSDLTKAGAIVYSGVASSTPTYSKGTPAWTSGQTYNLGTLASTAEPWICAVMGAYTGARNFDISSWTSPSWSERIDDYDGSSEHTHLFADTNGGWGGGSFAPSTATNYLSGAAYSRAGYIVELKAAAAASFTGLTVTRLLQG